MPRKIMKVVKKLKFWSRKRKKSSTRYVVESQTYHVPTTSICRRCSVEPSAPPLPSWLELEEAQAQRQKQTHYDFPFPSDNSQSQSQSHYYHYYNYNHSYCDALEPDPAPKPFVGVEAKQDRAEFVEIMHNLGPGEDSGVAAHSQQQQQVVPGYGYGYGYGYDDYGKIVDGGGFARKEGSGSGGFLGCIIHIMGCFCPCLSFHEREITHNPYHRLSLSHFQKEHHT